MLELRHYAPQFRTLGGDTILAVPAFSSGDDSQKKCLERQMFEVVAATTGWHVHNMPWVVPLALVTQGLAYRGIAYAIMRVRMMKEFDRARMMVRAHAAAAAITTSTHHRAPPPLHIQEDV